MSKPVEVEFLMKDKLTPGMNKAEREALELRNTVRLLEAELERLRLAAAVYLHTDFIYRKVDSLRFDTLARSTAVPHVPQPWGNVHLTTELFNLAVHRDTAH